MENLNLTALDILTFIPAGNKYELAIRFYQEIGFELTGKSNEVAGFRKDKCGFLLQNYQNEWAQGNFMMVLTVDNLDDWWQKLSGLNLPEKYEGVKLRASENYPWGKREIHLIDPCGVLWHIAAKD